MYKILLDSEDYLAGITVKDRGLAEEGNMALHTSNHLEAIIGNRKQLAKELQLSLDQFVCANQTHSDHFYKVKARDGGREAYALDDAINDVDALYTFEKGLVLTTFTADCVPVIFYSEADGIIGTIHSGWKGTVQSITEKVFTHIAEKEHVDLSNMSVHIGTCLSQSNFEVDADVADQFKALAYANKMIDFDEERQKYLIDNQAVVQMQCERVGIKRNNIIIDQTCTMNADQGFSYREDKQTGRHMTFIMQKE